jgi:uncharacterized protein (TIGR03086 family)
MESTADRYRRLAGRFADTVASVPADGWDNATPCEDWTARDLVRHVVDSQNLFLGLVGRPPVSAPSVDDDPVAAWTTTSGVIQADLEDPVAASTEFDGFFGRTAFSDAVDRFLCMDLVVHRWDLARAAGVDTTIPPEDVTMVMERAALMGDALRSPGAFALAIEPPPGADAQADMLAFLGRTA